MGSRMRGFWRTVRVCLCRACAFPWGGASSSQEPPRGCCIDGVKVPSGDRLAHGCRADPWDSPGAPRPGFPNLRASSLRPTSPAFPLCPLLSQVPIPVPSPRGPWIGFSSCFFQTWVSGPGRGFLVVKVEGGPGRGAPGLSHADGCRGQSRARLVSGRRPLVQLLYGFNSTHFLSHRPWGWDIEFRNDWLIHLHFTSI